MLYYSLVIRVLEFKEDRSVGKEQNQKKETKKKAQKTMKEKKIAKLEKKKNR